MRGTYGSIDGLLVRYVGGRGERAVITGFMREQSVTKCITDTSY